MEISFKLNLDHTFVFNETEFETKVNLLFVIVKTKPWF